MSIFAASRCVSSRSEALLAFGALRIGHSVEVDVSHRDDVLCVATNNYNMLMHNKPMRKPRATSAGLRKRIRTLVDARFAGSVNAAAHGWGISQPSLQRIVDGTTKLPRQSTLARIAELEVTTIEWLLTGNGADPLGGAVLRHSSRESEEWEATINNLGLRAPDYEAVLFLPRAVHDAAEQLLGAISRAKPDAVTRKKVGGAWAKAERLACKSWNILVATLVEVYGTEAVRTAWKSARFRARLGFSDFGDRLLSRADTRSALEEMVKADEKASEEQAKRFAIAANTADPLEQRRRMLAVVEEMIREASAPNRR